MLSGKSLVRRSRTTSSTGTPLFSEPPNVLQSELRERSLPASRSSRRFLKPRGRRSLREKTSVDVKRLGPYLRRLQELNNQRTWTCRSEAQRTRPAGLEDDFFRSGSLCCPVQDHLESGASAHECIATRLYLVCLTTAQTLSECSGDTCANSSPDPPRSIRGGGTR
jgi:hypothetical protein